MRFLKGLLKIIALLVIIAAIVGLFLPDSAHVERSATIQAPASKIFGYINNLKETNKWSPWYERDPDMQQRYEGPDSGVGAKVYWSSENPQVGTGSQEIIESKVDSTVKTELDFGAQGTAQAFFQLTPNGEETNVVWGFDTNFGYDLVGRYFGLMFENWIGVDYERGLANLKKLAEGG